MAHNKVYYSMYDDLVNNIVITTIPKVISAGHKVKISSDILTYTEHKSERVNELLTLVKTYSVLIGLYYIHKGDVKALSKYDIDINILADFILLINETKVDLTDDNKAIEFIFNNVYIKNIRKRFIEIDKDEYFSTVNTKILRVYCYEHNVIDTKSLDDYYSLHVSDILFRMLYTKTLCNKYNDIVSLFLAYDIYPIVDMQQHIHSTTVSYKNNTNVINQVLNFKKTNNDKMLINIYDIHDIINAALVDINNTVSTDTVTILYNVLYTHFSNKILSTSNVLEYQHKQSEYPQYSSSTLTVCDKTGTIYHGIGKDEIVNIIGVYVKPILDVIPKKVDKIDIISTSNSMLYFTEEADKYRLLLDIFHSLVSVITDNFIKSISPKDTWSACYAKLENIRKSLYLSYTSKVYNNMLFNAFNRKVHLPSMQEDDFTWNKKIIALPKVDLSFLYKPPMIDIKYGKYTITKREKGTRNVTTDRLYICQHTIDMRHNMNPDDLYVYVNKYIDLTDEFAICKSCNERMPYFDNYDTSKHLAMHTTSRNDSDNITPVMSAVNRMALSSGFAFDQAFVYKMVGNLSDRRSVYLDDVDTVPHIILCIITTIISYQNKYIKDKLCTIERYTKLVTKIYESIDVYMTRALKQTSIVNYPLLGYLIFYLSCVAVNVNIWKIPDDTSKLLMNSRIYLARKCVNVLNSIIKKNNATHYSESLIITNYFRRLHTIYKSFDDILVKEITYTSHEHREPHMAVSNQLKLGYTSRRAHRTYALGTYTFCKDTGRWHDWKITNGNMMCTSCSYVYDVSKPLSITPDMDIYNIRIKRLDKQDTRRSFDINEVNYSIHPTYKLKIITLVDFINQIQDILGKDFNVNEVSPLDTKYELNFTYKNTILPEPIYINELEWRLLEYNDVQYVGFDTIIKKQRVTMYFDKHYLTPVGYAIDNKVEMHAYTKKYIKVTYSLNDMLLSYGYDKLRGDAIIDKQVRFNELKSLCNKLIIDIHKEYPTYVYHMYEGDRFISNIFEYWYANYHVIKFTDEDRYMHMPVNFDIRYARDIDSKSCDMILHTMLSMMLMFIELNKDNARLIAVTYINLIKRHFYDKHAIYAPGIYTKDVDKYTRLINITNIVDAEQDDEDNNEEEDMVLKMDYEEAFDMEQTHIDEDDKI